jgi:hypothetical protein
LSTIFPLWLFVYYITGFTWKGIARYFMNCCRETTKMGLPLGNRPAVPRDWFEAYLDGTSQEPTPEDAKKDAHIRGRSK